MSRSKKKIPIHGIAGTSDKKDKRLANRKFRRRERVKISMEEFNNIPVNMNEVSNVWSMSKDGKRYWSLMGLDEKMTQYWYKLMRK